MSDGGSQDSDSEHLLYADLDFGPTSTLGSTLPESISTKEKKEKKSRDVKRTESRRTVYTEVDVDRTRLLAEQQAAAEKQARTSTVTRTPPDSPAAPATPLSQSRKSQSTVVSPAQINSPPSAPEPSAPTFASTSGAASRPKSTSVPPPIPLTRPLSGAESTPAATVVPPAIGSSADNAASAAISSSGAPTSSSSLQH